MNKKWVVDEVLDLFGELASTAILGGMLGAFGKAWGKVAKVDAKKFTGNVVDDLKLNSEFI
jgi:hypothetical protein